MNPFAHMLDGGALALKGLTPGHLALAALAAAAVCVLAYLLQRGRPLPWVKPAATIFRLAAFALILMILTEPVIRGEEALPQQSFLVHVVDTSSSMDIADVDDASRAEAVAKAMDSKDRAELDRIYRPIDFTFDETLRIASNATPDEAARGTDLAGALRALRMQVGGLDVSGVVLCTDGNPSLNGQREALREAAGALGVPIYAVGAGPRQPAPDVWIDRVAHPEQTPRSVGAKVSVFVGARGMRWDGVDVVLEEEGREIDTIRLRPDQNDVVMTAEFAVTPDTTGVRGYRVFLRAGDRDAYPWNNEKQFFMECVQERQKVLYIEGHPRHEYRFLRAAFEDDERFQVTSVLYVTRQGNIYRQGIEHKSQLRGGFPDSREELYGYDVVVIGDISARQFTPDQLVWLRDFVRVRGGGMLFLGGESSFEPDGYGRTSLAEVLPFGFVNGAQMQEKLRVSPTNEGRERSLFGPYNARTESKPPWEVLPPLNGLYPLNDLKPGAVALCRIETGQPGKQPPVVAYQRYGRGTSLICGISNTWPWKFQTPSENPSYAAFWKEMMLILAERERNRLELRAMPQEVPVGAEVTLQALSYDAAFEPDPGVKVTFEVAAADGARLTLDAEPVADEEATFAYVLRPTTAGLYRVRATSQSPAEAEAQQAEAMFLVLSEAPEFEEVQLNVPLLRELATLSGGEYVHLSDYGQLKTRIRPVEGSLMQVTERSIWDRGEWLTLVLAALALEWFIRRAGRLA